MATPYGHEVPLWEAGEDVKREANITRYMQWLKSEKGLNFETREELWQWSVNNLEDFWASLWDYFHIKASSPYSAVLSERKMPGAKWFPGAKLTAARLCSFARRGSSWWKYRGVSCSRRLAR